MKEESLLLLSDLQKLINQVVLIDYTIIILGGIIMNTPIAVRIECAKGEILNAMETIQKRHALPPCIMDGVLSSVLAEVRSEAKIELINSTNAMMASKDEELEKAKKAAKRVLKTEPDKEQPEQDAPENPEK